MSNAPAALDHGQLNLPLHKRGAGSIDAQIDRWKREKQATDRQVGRDAAAQRKQRAADVKLALAAIAALTPERVKEMAKNVGCDARQVRPNLRSAAQLNPQVVLRAMMKETK